MVKDELNEDRKEKFILQIEEQKAVLTGLEATRRIREEQLKEFIEADKLKAKRIEGLKKRMSADQLTLYSSLLREEQTNQMLFNGVLESIEDVLKKPEYALDKLYPYNASILSRLDYKRGSQYQKAEILRKAKDLNDKLIEKLSPLYDRLDKVIEKRQENNKKKEQIEEEAINPSLAKASTLISPIMALESNKRPSVAVATAVGVLNDSRPPSPQSPPPPPPPLPVDVAPDSEPPSPQSPPPPPPPLPLATAVDVSSNSSPSSPKPPPPPPSPVGIQTVDLMAAIRQGAKLKEVQVEPQNKNSGNDIMGEIGQLITQNRKLYQQESLDESQSEEWDEPVIPSQKHYTRKPSALEKLRNKKGPSR